MRRVTIGFGFQVFVLNAVFLIRCNDDTHRLIVFEDVIRLYTVLDTVNSDAFGYEPVLLAATAANTGDCIVMVRPRALPMARYVLAGCHGSPFRIVSAALCFPAGDLPADEADVHGGMGILIKHVSIL